MSIQLSIQRLMQPTRGLQVFDTLNAKELNKSTMLGISMPFIESDKTKAVTRIMNL